MAKVKINFSIDSLAEGAGKELIERELSDIFNNINDPNADPTKKRSLIVKVDFVPDADYDEVKASINVSSKLAPAAPVTTKIMTGRDLNTGMIAASELKSGVKGQTYIDEQGDVRTDTGEKVEDIEKKSKIIDLQEREVRAMDLTKEALDYLAERGIRPEERKLKINGQEYIIDKNGEPVLVEPVIYKAKEPIRLNTLSGLVDYIKSNIDDFDDLILHVVDEKLVELKGKLQPNGDRELLAIATAIVPEFDFDSYMDIESFNIALQSQFVKTDDRDILLKVVGNLKEDNVRSTGDDGISQAV